MSLLQTYKDCTQCGGSGTYYPHGENGLGDGIPCPWPGCVNGKIWAGDVDLEEDHFFTHDILEACDTSELLGLTTDKKMLLDTIIGATIVDLSEGTQVRGWLMTSLFPEGTTTHDNLLTLLGE